MVWVLKAHLALMETRYPTLQGWRESDVEHLFRETLTPPFVLELVADLVLEGRVSQRQRVEIETRLLACVDAQGHWKAIE